MAVGDCDPFVVVSQFPFQNLSSLYILFKFTTMSSVWYMLKMYFFSS